MDNQELKKLDVGCGTRKPDGYIGIDKTKYEGVDILLDCRFNKLPFEDESIDEIRTSHFLEHLTFEEVLFIMNEFYRVLKPGHLLDIIVPHGLSFAGMADLSHKTFFTEDTFGYFTPENQYYYEWTYEHEGKIIPVINKWKVLSNDQTPPYEYSVRGWVEVKLREIHAIMEKL